MTEPKNPAPEGEANELSEEELEAASGGLVAMQQKVKSPLSSQQVSRPVEVSPGAMPSVKDSLL